MPDFLFTWKPDKWPYENLKQLIDRFEAGETVIEAWRCGAHRQVRPGGWAYLYNQGPAPNGIFGIAQIIGEAKRRENVQEGEGTHEVPLRFTLLFDPTKARFLMAKEEIQDFGERIDLGNQSSGIRLPARLGREIDKKAAQITSHSLSLTDQEPHAAPLSATKTERLIEAYTRNQPVVDELKKMYGGRCQICDTVPFSGMFGSIVEGHHIVWLSRNGKNNRGNIILLCPNHHAAIHAADPSFDPDKLEFRFGTKSVPVRLDRHLKAK